MTGTSVRHDRVRADGVDLHVARAGEGPPVVLLHGFPENWRSWHRQIPALARAGLSVWAPDMRGYNLSDIPAGREPYHLRHLVADVAALVRATGSTRAHVVGHDWGGIVAWTFAGMHQELLHRLVILNAPHVELYRQQVRRVRQMLKSWYVLFFMLPMLPELALSARDFAAVRRMFTRYPARPGAFSAEDVELYIRALSRPGALTAALNYYRANRDADAQRMARASRVAADTLVIWGDRDPALGLELLDGLERVAPRVRVQRIANAGHWVQNEAPEEVNGLLVEFLKGRERPSRYV